MLRSTVALVIPAHNEGANLRILIPEIFEVVECELNLTVFVVDDGSTDSTGDILDSLRKAHPNLVSIQEPDRGGKARALSVGLARAIALSPDIICTMDGDCQDNPIYLPLLVQKALSGFDLVTARRVNRADLMTKRIPSKIYNRLVRFLFGTPGRDHNSGMKALSPRLARFLIAFLRADMHRHISVMAHWQGFSLSELPVINRERRNGASKYGVSRLLFGLEELVMVRFLLWRLDKRLDFYFYCAVGMLASGVSGFQAVSMLTNSGAPSTLFEWGTLILSALVISASLVGAFGVMRSGRFLTQIKATKNSVLSA